MAGRRGGFRRGVRVIRRIIEKIIEKVVPHDKGEFTIGAGVHEIVIKTENKTTEPCKGLPENKPIRVWVSLEQSGELPVCGGNVDKAGTEITNDGFVLHLNISSTERLVKWYAEL